MKRKLSVKCQQNTKKPGKVTCKSLPSTGFFCLGSFFFLVGIDKDMVRVRDIVSKSNPTATYRFTLGENEKIMDVERLQENAMVTKFVVIAALVLGVYWVYDYMRDTSPGFLNFIGFTKGNFQRKLIFYSMIGATVYVFVKYRNERCKVSLNDVPADVIARLTDKQNQTLTQNDKKTLEK